MLRQAVRIGSWVAVILLVGVVSSVATAGDTEPPAGPIAGTMKPLDQVEPRVPIGPSTTPGDPDSTYRITSLGSYYLAADVAGEVGKAGIEIAAERVTVDLMGYSVAGVAGTLSGITVVGTRDNIVVRNGFAIGWGGHGVDLALLGVGEGVAIRTSCSEPRLGEKETADRLEGAVAAVIRQGMVGTAGREGAWAGD